ncbi:MAG TPA: glycoside hydrolase family 38 C-terminal domain-containing protein [Armatimonadota bacterium]|jgi:alpha-mannosidase
MRNHLALAVIGLALAASCDAAQPAAQRARARSAYNPATDKVLYEVGYSHLDTQWRWSYLDTIGEYIPNTMKDNFALFEKYPNYIFSFSGSNRYRMMKEYYPKDFAKVKEYIRKKRWFVAGSSVEENDVNVPSAESIIRQLLYGNHFFTKEMGETSIDFILPDCFGFPASLPSILAHCGIKGFSTQKLTWGFPYPIPFTVGNWYGPDGKFVTSALDAGSYSARVNEDLSQSQFILDRINKIGEKSGAFVDFRYYGTGDVGGAPAESSAQWMEKSVNGTGPVTVVASPSDQIFRDLTPKQVSKLPTYKGDLELTQHSAGSLTSQAYMKRWNRKNELLADSAERASVAADWLGAEKYPQQHMNDAWRLILGGQFHDILPGTSIPKAYEFSWNDEVTALNHSASALSDGAGAVIRAMDTRAKGVSVVVYNPLSVAREDVVDAKVRFDKAPAAVRVYGPGGVEVPSQVAGRDGGTVEVLFLAKAPSVGFVTYDVRPSAKPCVMSTGLSVQSGVLQNNRYKVTLNAGGDVEQITDKANGRPLLAGPARLALRFEEPDQWPAWNMDWRDQSAPSIGYVSGPAKVRVVENGPVRVALEVTRNTSGSKFVQVIRLAAAGAGNRVEFDNTINWNERKTTLKTEFPLAVSNEMATYNLGMGTIKRSTDDEKKYEVVSHEWFDLTDAAGRYGVSVLEDSKFGSDKPDDHTLRLTLLRTPGARSYPDQATQDVGTHRVLYALEGHNGSWKGKTPWEAARLNQPLVAFQSPAHAGKLGGTFSLFTVNTTQVAITAIKKAEDSDDVIVRLQELSGAPVSVTLSAAAPIVSAREVNGQERTIGPANLKSGALSLKMSAYNPRAFAIRLGKPAARLTMPVCKPLAIPYDVVAAGYDGKANAKGFDGKGHTFPIEMFPGTFVSGGVKFQMARRSPGAKTALACNGQTVKLPGGMTRVYVLAAAFGGDTHDTFVAGGKAIPVSVQDWSGFIGQWDNRIWEKPASAPGLQLLDGGIYGLQPAYIKRDPIAFYATHRHNAAGGNDIYAYAYVFRYGLDVPAGAKTLTLPKNPAIRVFAVTAASGTNDAAKPAQYLYDAFGTTGSTPELSPASGSSNDTMSVSLRPSVYDSTAKLVYTTDGSDPVATSAVYQMPIRVSHDTVIRARAFHGNKPAGPVVSGTYKVDDRTPPTVTGITSAAGSPLIRVTFSEPVNASSGANADLYKIEGLTVRTARLAGDGRSVDITVSPAPEAGQSYSLSVNGVQDTSPHANSIAMAAGRAFSPATPILALLPGLDNAQGTVPGIVLRVLGAPAEVQGPHGAALSFNGTNDAVIVPNRAELNPTDAITLSAWIHPANWNDNHRIVQKGNNDNQFRLTASEGKLLFELSGVGSAECALPTAGQWHHVAATYDGANIFIYVDGVSVARADGTGAIATSSDPLCIATKGARAPVRDFYAGDIADFRLYDKALLPEHIAALAKR